MNSTSAPLKSVIRLAPNPFDAEAASRLVEELPTDFFSDKPSAVRMLIEGIGGCSPFLSRLISRSPALLSEVLEASPNASVDVAIAEVWGASSEKDLNAQMRCLRLAKRRVSLALALAEISGALDVMSATHALTRFADAAVGASMRMALNDLRSKGFEPLNEETPERNCGICAIAMGKMGAHELNYSSDIDLIVAFDSDNLSLGDKDRAREIAVAATKAMVRRLSDQTADGYVFRTDLRLRPDPGVSAAAVSLNAAEAYYEAYGQNWERAAYIKARAAAGDLAVGEELLRRLQPFVWRKYLDFAAIDDILSIKRQIHASKGGASIEFFGHDLKTGVGGIREIEFSVQTQQLILGGRNPELRVRETLQGLTLLRQRGVLNASDAETLDRNYRDFRLVEHRIQMMHDEQTHKVPDDDDGATRLANFLGHSNLSEFKTSLMSQMTETHELFSQLFGRDEQRQSGAGAESIGFRGPENDSTALTRLESLGFKDPSRIADAFRHWRSGGVRATRTARARRLLDELTPEILNALSRAGAPDEAFVAFDRFIATLPSGVQIFSLLSYNKTVFDTLIRIVTIAPHLAKELARKRVLVEALTETNWPQPLKTRNMLEAEIDSLLSDAADFETAMNILRRWNAEQRFESAAQLSIGAVNAATAASHFTMLAEIVIDRLLPIARRETEKRHGYLEREILVLALGRLGAGRMTASSDIDIMFLYDMPNDVFSDGEKPLDGVTYFTRLVRRFLTGMSTPTEEGVLYEVDMQLRPSGAAGPAAVSFEAFRKYYENDAWTWEKMALVKARALGPASEFKSRVETEIDRILKRRRDPDMLAADVESMRQRLAGNKPAEDKWDLKRVAGGLTELDFIIEYLTLLHAPDGLSSTPEPMAAFKILYSRDCLTENQFRSLSSADELFETVLQIGRAATGGRYSPDAAGAALNDRMLEATASQCLESFETKMSEAQAAVRQIYRAIVLGEASCKEIKE